MALFSFVSVLWVLFGIFMNCNADQFSFRLLNLARYPLARCIDGSAGGYYISEGFGAGKLSWQIHTEAGGWCLNEEDCLDRSRMFYGSSTTWGPGVCPDDSSPVCYYGPFGMLSRNETVNPRFFDWNRVFIGYCDGGSFSGTRLDPITVNGTELFFRGRYILDAVYDDLVSKSALKDATEVLVRGSSAGGLAVYLHLDYLTQKIKSIAPMAKVAGIPGAGFFLDIASYATGRRDYTAAFKWVFEAQEASVNQKCMAFYSAEQWQCFIAAVTLPFIRTRLFVSNSMADEWQMSEIMQLGCDPVATNMSASGIVCNSSQLDYLNVFRATMLKRLSPVLLPELLFGGEVTDLQSKGEPLGVNSQPGAVQYFNGVNQNGAFLQECRRHGVVDDDVSWSQVLVQNQTQRQTLQAWYDQTNETTGLRYSVFDGVWDSNPTCQDVV